MTKYLLTLILTILVSSVFAGNIKVSDKDSSKVEVTELNHKKNDSDDNRESGRIVGLKIGGGPVNVSDFKNFQKHKGGFYVGISKEFLFTKTIGLSVEGHYWLTGFTNDTTFVKTSFNYISVPVQLNININKFYIAAGLYGAINLRSSEVLNDSKEYFGFQNNRYQQFDWGAVFNIGFKWRFLGFDVRYVMGLQDVVKDMPGKQYNSALFFGASFHLMKRPKGSKRKKDKGKE
jgi:hypothetical protein